jgi:adenylate cyclase class IV
MRKRARDVDGRGPRGERRLLPEVEASFALSREELAEVRVRLGARAASARHQVLDQSSHHAPPGDLVRVRGRRPAAAGAGRSRIELKRHRGHTAEEFGLEVESFEKGAALLELLGHPQQFFLQKIRETYVLPCAGGGERGHAEAAIDSYPGLRPFLEVELLCDCAGGRPGRPPPASPAAYAEVERLAAWLGAGPRLADPRVSAMYEAQLGLTPEWFRRRGAPEMSFQDPRLLPALLEAARPSARAPLAALAAEQTAVYEALVRGLPPPPAPAPPPPAPAPPPPPAPAPPAPAPGAPAPPPPAPGAPRP